MKTYFCYRITNRLNGKHYIGFASQPDIRWRNHLAAARQGKGFALHAAIRKYGWENFDKEIICCGRDWDSMVNFIEPLLMQQYDSITPGGYNIRPCNSNGPLPDSIKEKMRQTYAERTSKPGYVHPLRGKSVLKEEQKQKISEALKGRVRSKEHCQALSIALTEKYQADPMSHGRIGTKHSEESKQKIAEAKRGVALTEEHRGKISASLTGRPGTKHSEESKQKIAEAKRGVALSDEHKEKIGAAHRGKVTSDQTKKKQSESCHRTADWEITDPSGKTFIIHNLRVWCKERGYSQGNFQMVAKGRLKHAYGHKCRKLEGQ